MDLRSSRPPPWSDEEDTTTNANATTKLSLMPQRSLRSWILLSNGDGSRLLSAVGGDLENGSPTADMDDDEDNATGTLQGKQCVNNN